jgi:hypothetical protein
MVKCRAVESFIVRLAGGLMEDRLRIRKRKKSRKKALERLVIVSIAIIFLIPLNRHNQCF